MSDVVDRVLAALNERNLDAFVACYAPDATIGDGYERIAAAGHERHIAVYLIADGLIARERLIA